ncbi:MAG TPA: type II toxin-antitoxin system VapC family toxin [Microbacteriaceae bacterium]|nr:type II toxin-antitoxin system VapC family toxin [Microbacteriaceae bacterium]
MTQAMEQAYLIDSSVPLLHLGEASVAKVASRAVMRSVLDASLRAYASTEMVQEVAFHRRRMTGDPKRAAQEARDVSAGIVMLAFDHEILDLALDLMATGTIRGRDAVHAATAAVYGITKVISVDRGFDAVPGLERVDPRELA